MAHAQNPRQPAPEDGAGSPSGNGHSHTDDVPRADVGRQGHHQGAERGNVPLVRVVLHKVQFQGLEQVALRKTQNDGQVQMRAQQQNEQGPSPQKGTEGGQPGGEHVSGLEESILQSVKHTAGTLRKNCLVASSLMD